MPVDTCVFIFLCLVQTTVACMVLFVHKLAFAGCTNWKSHYLVTAILQYLNQKYVELLEHFNLVVVWRGVFNCDLTISTCFVSPST